MAQRVRFSPSVLIVVGLVALAVFALSRSLSITTLLVFVVVVPSIILHELSHGVVALACGDDTARRARRLTLNPLRHVDPIGTIVLPAVLSLSGLGAFGYAKPVPINPRRMRHPRNDSLLVSLAGPACNLLLAAASIVILRADGSAPLVGSALQIGAIGALSVGQQILFLLGFLNVSLAVFNLIPLPPLDGSAVVERLLPPSAWPMWLKVRTYAMPVLLVLVLLDPHQFLARIFDPAQRLWARVLVA